MSLKSSRAGREFTLSSRCSAQFVTATLPTVPLHWLVLLSSSATALVTERSRNRIPPGAFVVPAAGLASSTTLIGIVLLARLKKVFRRPLHHHGIHGGLAGFQINRWRRSRPELGSSTMLLLSPGAPSLKSRSANAASSTAATRLVALNQTGSSRPARWSRRGFRNRTKS
jgi:hypothetical protein